MLLIVGHHNFSISLSKEGGLSCDAQLLLPIRYGIFEKFISREIGVVLALEASFVYLKKYIQKAASASLLYLQKCIL